MAKGRTTKPLRIWVTDAELFEAAEVQALLADGHTVTFVPWSTAVAVDADMVLGPQCFFMTPALVKFVKLAVQHARARVYGKGKVKHGVEDTELFAPKADNPAVEGELPDGSDPDRDLGTLAEAGRRENR